MTKHKHLTFDDRFIIESMLNERKSFRCISSELSKDPSTISKEVKNHLVFRRTGGMRVAYNACIHRHNCSRSHICSECHSDRHYTLCRRCSLCNRLCKDFQQEICSKLLKPPYVCNGCYDRSRCSLEKRFYRASEAHQEYRSILSESRSGISLTEMEIRYLDQLISPLIRQNQSPHHIYVTNKDSLTISERTNYRLIDARILSAMNIDLPRKVRFRKRKKAKPHKVDKACRIHRTYSDYLQFLCDNPDTPTVQLDSVEGRKGGKALLTIHFVRAEMMLAFLRDYNDSKSVIDIFNQLYQILGPDSFRRLFRVCLADNGTEFSNPSAIELDENGLLRTRIFYCDASAPHQKGSAERNHEFIRFFVPKGKSFDSLTQADINIMMNHINSYCRESLGNKSPYDMFAFLYGEEILRQLRCQRIPYSDITLNASVFIREASYDV